MSKTEEAYGTPVTIDELVGHYKTQFLSADQFRELLVSLKENTPITPRNTNPSIVKSFEIIKQAGWYLLKVTKTDGHSFETPYKYKYLAREASQGLFLQSPKPKK